MRRKLVADSVVFCLSLVIYLLHVTLPWSFISVASLCVLRVRWQILGAYAAAIIYFASDLLQNYFDLPQIESFISIFCAILVLSALITNFVFPLFDLPPPSGQYRIGTRISSWYDKERDRRLAVQLWYPSEATPTSSPVPFWWPNSTTMGSALCSLFGVPFFLLLHLDHCKSNSYLELTVINQTLPIIVSSHGFYGFKGDRSYFFEQFASNGYLVLGFDHPGDCAMCIFPDGETIPFSAFLNPGDDEWKVRNTGLINRVGDIDFVIDRLRSISAGKDTLDSIEQILKDCMDFNQLGIFGHSYGAATCVQYAQEGRNADDVKAVAGLDPWIFPLSPKANGGIQKPLLFISSDCWIPGNQTKERRKAIVLHSAKGSASFVVKGTNHHNFDDMPFIVHKKLARLLRFIGEIPTSVCFTLTGEFTLSFFDTFVRGIKASKQFPSLEIIKEESRSNK